MVMMMMKEMMKMIMNIFSCVTAGWQKTKTLGNRERTGAEYKVWPEKTQDSVR